MRVNSMDKLPKEKKKFSMMELSTLAILVAGLCFIFFNIIVSFFKWLIPIVIENYVVIIIAVIVLLLLRKFLFKKKKK